MILRALLKNLILPPTSLLLLLLIAWLGWRRWPKFSRTLLGGSLLVFWLLSLPIVGGVMLQSLEKGYQPYAIERVGEGVGEGVEKVEPEAIVVLGGGRVADSREYSGDTVNSRTLGRLRYGAHLYRETGLPVLLAGGRVYERDVISEAQLMARVMSTEFRVPVEWLEVNSKTTAENAAYSAEILHAQGIESVLLVTQAWHMPRAEGVFREAGLTVIPAPTGFTVVQPDRLMSWVPSVSGLYASYFALHEMLGGWFYRWQGK
ncbi:YdcF family protein [Pseudomaricurvus sp.]|uniref:YdcF family protein n=1 Tax=Pseudomaricurvus sp. TaxID=2004510 RepID=UPI003F6CDB6E